MADRRRLAGDWRRSRPSALILFAALFDFEGRPVEVASLGAAPSFDTQVKVLGASRQAALVCRLPPSVPGGDEQSGIEELADRYWIVGRMRLDARDQLQARLGTRLSTEGIAVSDARLCLHAYATWGERCVDFLDGDFAFVLWDDTRQCLFGACDRLGRRSLFHARSGSCGWMGDSLDWIAQQGPAEGGLDDYWIADLLTLNCSREFERTVYRDVNRLGPAHFLSWSEAGAVRQRYWRLDIPEPLYLARRGAYAERFRELVSLAIADRIPAGKIGIAMSGGLDSTMLAACTVALTGEPSRVVAYCEHYEELMHIEEDRFASMAARHLGIDLHIEPFDNSAYDPHWQSRGIRPAEPTTAVINAHCVRGINDALARRSPVWLEGEGPDNALRLDRDAYLSWLRARHAWGRLGRALLAYAAVKGWSGWGQTFRRHLGSAVDFPVAPPVPQWLDPGFVGRLRLAERIRDLGTGGDPSHPWHPEAISSFTSPIWLGHFGGYDFQESLSPLRWRSPFLDLRVLTFMLSVPPIPWGWKKQLVREAMKGRLPQPVLQRPKTPLPVFPQFEMLRRHGLPSLLGPKRLVAYVDPDRLPRSTAEPVDLLQSINVYVLDHWLGSG